MMTSNIPISRRSFLKVAGTALAGGLLATTGLVSLRDESGDPVIDRISIPIKNLPAALEGFTIAQLSDIHLYPLTQLETVQRAVDLANSLSPGVTVLTGDYVWRSAEAIFDLAPVLAKLNARHGAFATLGNHDYWTDTGAIKTGFQEVRLPLLVNQGIPISEGGSVLYLAGLDDGWSGSPDLDLTLAEAPPGAPVVFLCHEPDLADQYSLDGRIQLQLSGHTHAGQIRVLGMGAVVHPYLGEKYEMGLYNVNGMWLYTNRGIGCISEPLRINCPPEVTEFTLVRA
jgi:predicted MPP superfamily phosphohydrolase